MKWQKNNLLFSIKAQGLAEYVIVVTLCMLVALAAINGFQPKLKDTFKSAKIYRTGPAAALAP